MVNDYQKYKRFDCIFFKPFIFLILTAKLFLDAQINKTTAC